MRVARADYRGGCGYGDVTGFREELEKRKNHHVTLVMLAHSFPTLETLRNKKNLLGRPCRGRIVRFNGCCALGSGRAPLLRQLGPGALASCESLTE
jgi:hypothetical protein